MMRVLVTCPPMISMIDELDAYFFEKDLDYFVPEFTQVMEETKLVEILPEFDGWIIGDDPATKQVLESGTSCQLKAVVKWGIGIDNVDIAALRVLGLPFTNTPGMFADEVADVAMCYVAGLARDLFCIDRGVREFDWPKPTGISLKDKVLGLVGYGSIGKQIARRAATAGMIVVLYDPALTKSEIVDGHEVIVWPERVESLEFIVFSCPLTRDNRHMFNVDTLARVKPGMRIVNVARGPLIAEAALLRGLESGVIHSAALDVMEQEPLPKRSRLRDFERCVFGSHNASNTREAVLATSKLAIDRLAEFLVTGA